MGIRVFTKLELFRQALFALAGYVAITLWFFFPLLIHWDRLVVGWSGGDTLIYLWNLWWFNEGSNLEGQSLLWSDYQLYPDGLPLAFHPFSIIQLIWTSPIYRFLGGIAAHNATVLTGFVLTGFFTYLLGRKLGLSGAGSFIAGLVFTLSPFHFAHTLGGHIELVSLQWIPLTLLAMFLWLETGRYSAATLLGIAVALVFYTSLYLFFYTVVLVGCFFLYLVTLRRPPMKLDRLWRGLILAATSAAILVLPFFLAMRAAARDFGRPSGHITFSADLLGLFLPGGTSKWREYTRPIWEQFPGNIVESTAFLGWVTLLLAAVGAWYWRRRTFWVIVALLALVFALGPYLQIGGQYEVPLDELGWMEGPATRAADLARSLNPEWSISRGHIALPMPYLVLKKIPYFSFSRVPSRFLVITYLALGILVAAGSDFLTAGVRGKTRCLIFLLVSLTVILEFYPISRFASPSVHPFYQEMAREEGDFAIIDLSEPHQKILNQTVHEKRLIGGYVGGRAHLPTWQLFRERKIFFWENIEEFAAGLNWLSSLGAPPVRYLVAPGDKSKVIEWAGELELPIRFSDDELKVYRILQQEDE